MEKKEIRKIMEKLYDTPEETTNSVLNFVVETKTPAVDDTHNVRANLNNHHAVQRVGGCRNRKMDAVGAPNAGDGLPNTPSHCRPVVTLHFIPSAIATPPGVPVETFAYG
ncbi:hypothetical protein TWF696_006020 [Orbilia brochopaga]|uniref:Uncharacterized protein n=1 Tax=Orbilia brochopaga TaxID=3140254 RepID=A0AAV9UUW2_9PEZI